MDPAECGWNEFASSLARTRDGEVPDRARAIPANPYEWWMNYSHAGGRSLPGQ